MIIEKNKVLKKAEEITGKFKNLKNDNRRTENNYRCDWCYFEFSQSVRTSEGDRRSKVSDQVICPNCKVFIKTLV